jgi:hypothetical protein
LIDTGTLLGLGKSGAFTRARRAILTETQKQLLSVNTDDATPIVQIRKLQLREAKQLSVTETINNRAMVST